MQTWKVPKFCAIDALFWKFATVRNIWIFLASQDAQVVMLVTEWVSDWSLADLTDVTLVSDVTAHNSLQMSSSRDLTDVSEARDLTGVSED